MSQLVIKPGMSTPFGAAEQRVQQQAHRFVAASIVAFGRIRSKLLEPGAPDPRPEPAYFEAARMSREMYRL